MNLQSIAEIEAALRPYAERVKKTKFTLDTTRLLAAWVGNPQERLRVVHIAGTSGKTTTSYYAAGLLRAAEQKVGLTVSPHIASITERVQINGAPLAEPLFIRYFNEFIARVEASRLEPSYFEVMMLFAFWVFEKEKVDYAVIETGLGGLHDTSNICRREDKVCIITDIGYDHTHILGRTLPEIAAQKAGIIAEHNLVCMYAQSEQIMGAIDDAVARHGASLMLAPLFHAKTYFERNFALATFTYEKLAERDGLQRLEKSKFDDVFTSIHVPGRLEKIRVGGTLFVLDGAHNEQKMSALFATLDTLYPGEKWSIVLALKEDKDSSAILPMVIGHAREIVFSEFQTTQDMPAHASSAHDLMASIDGSGIKASAVCLLPDALRYFLDAKSERVLVTGSFFAVAEARAWLLEQKHGTIEL